MKLHKYEPHQFSAARYLDDAFLFHEYLYSGKNIVGKHKINKFSHVIILKTKWLKSSHYLINVYIT